MKIGLTLALALLCVAPLPASAQADATVGLDTTRPVIPLSNGLNTLSLTAPPLPARAFLAHRENFNAHGFDVLTLYIEAPSWQGARPQWQLVPVFDKHADDASTREQLTLQSSGGADCRLQDFRLLSATPDADATLIIASRALGADFASPAPVSFRFFRLRKNDGMPGRPVYYFEFDHARQAAKAYCDVGDALQAELGIGPDRPTEH